MWYAATPARRARQMFADLALLAWLVVAGLVGRTVHDLVAGLAEPARSLQDASARLDAGLHRMSDSVGRVPVVGNQLREALAQAQGPSADVGTATQEFIDTVNRLALITGIGTALALAAVVVLPWLAARMRFARRAGQLRRLLGGPAGPDERTSAVGMDLIALRALVRQPPRRLVGIHPDPLGAWRRGDPQVVRDLAALELRAAGLLPPGPSAPASGPTA